MATWNDPIAGVIQARANDIPAVGAPQFTNADNQFATQQQGYSNDAQLANSAAVSAQGGAGSRNVDDSPTYYAYNPHTQTILVNGQPVPKDFSAWQAAASLPTDQLQQMSVSQVSKDGYVPMSQGQLQDFLTRIGSHATAPMLSNAGTALMAGLRDIPAGVASISSAIGRHVVPVERSLGLNSMADFGQERANELNGVAEGYRQNNIDASKAQRAGLTLQEQAGQDTSFGAHPLTYAAGRGATMIGGAAPMVAAFGLNPALGVGVASAGSGAITRQMTEDSVQQKLANMSEDQLMADPAYAQLRQQGASDQSARQTLIQNAGQDASLVGGAIGAVTAPFYGKLGMGVLQRAGINGIIPEVAQKSFLTRALATGAEGTALATATNVPAQMVGENTAGVGSNNPLNYIHGEELANQFFGMGALGAMARHDPVRTAQASDIGVAAQQGMDQASAQVPPGGSDIGSAMNSRGPQQSRANSDMLISQVFGQGWRQNPKQVLDAAASGARLPDGTLVSDALTQSTRQQPLWDASQPANGQGTIQDLLNGIPREATQGAPEQAAPQAPVVNPNQTQLDFTPPGQSQDMFGAGPRSPQDLPPVPSPQGEPALQQPLPNQMAMQLPQGEPLPPAPQRASLIRQRAMERAQAANGPVDNGPPAGLPAPGTTVGGSDMVNSARQSLALVDGLVASKRFNPRTKSGAATLEQLSAERTRLQAIVDQAEPETPPMQQPQAPGMANGQDMPVAAGPDTSVEPPPIANPIPMSPGEAKSRAQTQADRAGVAPPVPVQAADQAIRTSEQGVSPSTAEPAQDLQAQADRLGKGSDAMFVAAGNEAQMPSVKRGVRKVTRDEGTLFTTNAAKAKAYREAPVVDDALLAKLQNLPETKAAAMRSGNASVVAAEDGAGNVVKEALSSPGGPNEAVVAAAAPKGGKVVRRDALTAQARREAKVGAETTPVAEQLKDRAAQARATRGTGAKKKVEARPVTPEELAPRTGAPNESARRAAESKLVEDVKANHPQLLDESDLLPPKEKSGAGRELTSPLVRVPLTRGEMSDLGTRIGDTARAEAQQIEAGTWGGRTSVMRRLLDTMGMHIDNDVQAKRVIKEFSDLSPEVMDRLLAQVGPRIMDSTLAKSIVRGSEAMRAAVPEQDLGATGRSGRVGADEPADALGGARLRLMDTGTRAPGAASAPEVNEQASNARAKVYGTDVPAQAADVIQHWSKTLERTSGPVLPDQFHVMTPDEARARYGNQAPTNGDGFAGDMKGPDGKTESVIAVDFKNLPGAAAIETMAHEMGHYVTDRIFAKAPKEDQTAVRQAFTDWLQTSGRGTPAEQMVSRLPPALGDLVRKSNAQPERAYAAEWHEWVADETAKWLVTDQKPKTAVDRFFSKIAATMKSLYAQVAGAGRPTAAVQRMLDNWVERSRALSQDDAAARALDMDYARNPSEAPRSGEVARSKIAAKAMQAKMESAVNGAMQLGKDAGTALRGNPTELKRSLNNAIGSITEGKVGRLVRKISYEVSNMEDIVGRYRNHGDFGKALVGWDHAMRLAEKYSKDAQQQGQLALERGQRLSTPVRNALEDLMYKTTVYGIHPDEGFGTGRNKYLNDADQTTADANQRRYGEVKSAWDQLKDITGNPQQVYKDLREAMGKLHEDVFEARREHIDTLPIASEAKEEAHRMLNMAEERMIQGPYFPLVREGAYITTAVMPATRIGEFATKAEADKIAKREKATNPHADMQIRQTDDGQWEVHAGEKAVYFHDTLRDAKNARSSIENEMREAWQHQAVGKAFDDILEGKDNVGEPLISNPMTTVDFYRKAETPTTGSFMAAINKLNDTGSIDPQAYRQLAEMYIESLPEASPRKAFLRRENIRGANRRMMAGYGRRLVGAAHAYGQAKIANERNTSWGQMYKRRGDSPEFGDVMTDLHKRQSILAARMVHNPLNTFASTVQDASSFMSLAFSPAFVAQQALQPILLSAPVLAARLGADGKSVGYAKVMGAFKDAYDGAVPFFTKRGAQQFMTELKRTLGTYGGDGQTLQQSAEALIKMFGKNGDEQDMLRYMNDRGTLDFSFLNAVTDASTLSAAGSKAKAIMRMSMAFPQQVEAMNRTVTGLAAYRLAKDARGMDHAEAVREANAIVSQTHGDYSRYNRPSAFNRPLLGMALQFKMYTQFLYSLLVSNMAHAMNPNLSRAERSQAMRTLGYVIGSHATFGGALGLGPIAAAGKLGLGALMYGMAGAGMIDKKKRDQTIGDWISAETEHYGDEMFGQGNGKALRTAATYGVPGMLGINMAAKVAIPDLTDTRFVGKPASEKDTPGDAIDRFALMSLGSVYSNMKRVANGTGDLLHGDPSGAAKQLLPSAPRAWLAAATESQDGIVTSGGTVLKDSKDVSPYETFLRATGIGSVDQADMYDQRAARFAAADRIETERSQVINAYRAAKTPEERRDAEQQVQQFNQGRDKEFQISNSSLQRAMSQKPGQMGKREAAAAKAIGQ